MQAFDERLVAIVVCVAVVLTLGAAAPARATPTVLYDGAQSGKKLEEQAAFDYMAYANAQPVATSAYASGATLLTTTGAIADLAGYYTPQSALPALSRTAGYTLTFTAHVVGETHQSNDRAGFSALILGDDKFGVELAFWQNEVWAQNDGANDPTPGKTAWTHGEGAAYNTTTGLVTYTVVIKESSYRVLADGVQILSGPLRKYAAPPSDNTSPLVLVYSIPNLIFFGDNSSKASTAARIARVELERGASGPYPYPDPAYPGVYLPLISRQE